MSIHSSFSRFRHLDELLEPLDTQEGVLSPATRQGRALTNLTGGTTFTAAQLAFLAGVVAGTPAVSKAIVASAALAVGGGIRWSASPRFLFTQAAPTAKTTSATLTAAEIFVGIITGNQGAAGAAAYTLPLATDFETALIAAFPNLANNDAFDFSVINISTVAAETITITTNTGWTLVGDMILAANTTGDESIGTFRARRTSATTYTLYRI